MTRYELLDIKAALEKALNWAHNQSDLFQIIDAKKLIEKELQESEPKGLNEAAQCYYEDKMMVSEKVQTDDISRAFKAGAEWMAGRGETHEAEIIESVPFGGTKWKRCVKVWLDDQFQAKGDKVVVQIRKK